MRLSVNRLCLAVVVSVLPIPMLKAADNPFHDAPASAKTTKNPLAGQQAAIDAWAEFLGAHLEPLHRRDGLFGRVDEGREIRDEGGR